jgi:hypothetical protein
LAGWGVLLPPTSSCSMLGWKMYSLSRGTARAGDRSRTTSSGEVACSLPRRGRTAGSYGTAQDNSELYVPIPWLRCGRDLAVGKYLASLLGNGGCLWFLIPREVTDGWLSSAWR